MSPVVTGVAKGVLRPPYRQRGLEGAINIDGCLEEELMSSEERMT